MTALEKLVRPFQTRVVTYPQRVLDTTQAPAADVVIAIGEDGQSKIYNESFSESQTIYADTKAKETSRTTETKRIENPDDSSQFVNVENIKTLKTEQGSGRTYQKTVSTFNNT